MITRETKKELISSVSNSLKSSKAFFLVDFKGLKVEQVTSLRKKLFPLKGEMKVARNTLATIALKGEGVTDESLMNALEGTNAFVFAFEDAASVAKAIHEYSKDNEALKLKSGYMEGKALSAKDVTFLATLPSKDVLRAQFLGVLSAPASKFVRTLNEVPASLARVLNSKAEQG